MVSRRKGSNKGDFLVSGPDIFISYCRPDRAAARLFAESFGEEGFDVWWDAVMHSGETFDEVIERNLRAAKAVVVLWSPRSVSSRWVRAEATQADRANKLIPVKIEACELPIIFELTHTADLADWQGDRSDGNWRSLVADLRRHVGPAKEKAVAATDEAAPTTEQTVEELKRAHSKDKSALAASQEELAKALERLGDRQESMLIEPTHVEEAQAKFFKRSDDRESESEHVHCLRRLHAPDGESLHMVGRKGLKIGRTAPSDIIVFEPGVSREHCLIEFAADKLRVTDLNSTNGTYIDNKRIGRAEILPVGSVLRVGNVSFGHEVHPRTDLRQQDVIAPFDLGTDPREPRIARS